MTDKIEAPLSSRLRPNIECAPWVIDEVKKLERALAENSFDWAADAREWGNALNSAGWEFNAAYQRYMGEGTSGKLFNNCKSIIRDVILEYAAKVKSKVESK